MPPTLQTSTSNHPVYDLRIITVTLTENGKPEHWHFYSQAQVDCFARNVQAGMKPEQAIIQARSL